jgi:hypothetical protein
MKLIDGGVFEDFGRAVLVSERDHAPELVTRKNDVE